MAVKLVAISMLLAAQIPGKSYYVGGEAVRLAVAGTLWFRVGDSTRHAIDASHPKSRSGTLDDGAQSVTFDMHESVSDVDVLQSR
jgi:hypothetical protein